MLWTTEQNDIKINIYTVSSDMVTSPEEQKLERQHMYLEVKHSLTQINWAIITYLLRTSVFGTDSIEPYRHQTLS